MSKYKIFIKSFSFKFKIEVDSRDTILQVKEKIKESQDIDVKEQELYLGDQKLENEKSLIDYNIEQNEQVRLIRIRSGGFQIYVNNFQGRSISLQVQSSYTIEKVKEEFKEKTGLPVDELRYIFNGKELVNNRLLSDYEVGAAGTLHLIGRLRGGKF